MTSDTISVERTIAASPDRIFALLADAAKHSSIEGGTLVRETWDVSQDKQRFLLKRSRMAPAAKVSMRETLERLAKALEA